MEGSDVESLAQFRELLIVELCMYVVRHMRGRLHVDYICTLGSNFEFRDFGSASVL